MTRKQLGLFDSPPNLEDMSPERRELIYNACKGLEKDATLNFVFDYVADNIRENIIAVTPEKNIVFDRFSINGVSLVKEHISAFASSRVADEGQYNKHDVT